MLGPAFLQSSWWGRTALAGARQPGLGQIGQSFQEDPPPAAKRAHSLKLNPSLVKPGSPLDCLFQNASPNFPCLLAIDGLRSASLVLNASMGYFLFLIPSVEMASSAFPPLIF